MVRLWQQHQFLRAALAWALLCLSIAPLAWSAQAPQIWQRDAALELEQGFDVTPQVQQLINLTISGSTPELLDQLQSISANEPWPAPVRDKVIYQFAQQLRSLPARSVPQEVMVWLQAYPSLTWVDHEDHAHGTVPLYNVRSVAVGTQNAWRRQESILEGLALLESSPRALVDAWLIDTHPSTRAGYLQALSQASGTQLQAVAKNAVQRAVRQPELIPLAGHAALHSRDTTLFGKAMSLGDSAESARLLRAAREVFAPQDIAPLLKQLVRKAPAATASVAIAELYPGYEVYHRDWLIKRLGDPQLGTTVALAMAADPDPQLDETLQQLARSKNQTVSARAKMTLDARQARAQHP